MGIRYLMRILRSAKRWCHLRELSGKRAAVDVSVWIYALSSYFHGTNVEQSIFRKIQLLRSFNIDVVLVFDGMNLEAKAETRRRRQMYYEKMRKSKEARIRTRRIQDSLKTMCRTFGVEYVQSLYEADAQIAYMVMQNEVDFVISEDSDFAAYGCEMVLYNLRGCEGQLFELSNFENCWDVRYEADCFLAVCILMGCDYWIEGLKGFGAKSAPKLYKKLLPKFYYRKMIKRLKVPVDEEKFFRAWYTFKHQLVYNFNTNQVVPLTNYSPDKTASDFSFAGDPKECTNAEHFYPDPQQQARNMLLPQRGDLINERSYFCDAGCSVILTSAAALVVHKKEVHPYRCDQCPRIFQYNYLLQRHKTTHGEKNVICPQCGKAFYNRSDLCKHKYAKHMERPRHKCNDCGITYKHKENLEYHQRVHVGEKPFICEICGLAFTGKRNLTQHATDVHSEERRHVCVFCGKEFPGKRYLESHIRSHLDEHPYVCRECGEEYKFGCTRERHMMIHANERKYKCNECGKGFNDPSTLREHKIVHTGEKRHVCSECGKAFTRGSILTIHMRNHTGDRPYKCSVCGKGFVDSKGMRRHELIHNEDRPYKCTFCGRGFKRADALSKHMKRCK